jgi:5-methylcytosine-specific restriction endonuclease McrA
MAGARSGTHDLLMTKAAKDDSIKLARGLGRLDRHMTRLSHLGIDPDQFLAEWDAEYERDHQERHAAVLKQMWADAALILVGGVPESCMAICRVCGDRKSTLTEFHRYVDPQGKPVRTRTCKPCFVEGLRRYTDRDKEVNALRKRLADIEKSTITCSRCREKKQLVAFPSVGRVCLQCRTEIAESLVKSLREQLSCNPGNTRIDVRRRQARGEFAGKRLQQAINQSDGTLSVEVIGRLFAEAEGKPCPYCGEYMSRATKSLDHMVPLGKGGVHGVVNLIVCCNRCNSAKRDREFADWISGLKEPYASMMAAEYEQRYGVKPSQSPLPLQYSPAPRSTRTQ